MIAYYELHTTHTSGRTTNENNYWLFNVNNNKVMSWRALLSQSFIDCSMTTRIGWWGAVTFSKAYFEWIMSLPFNRFFILKSNWRHTTGNASSSISYRRNRGTLTFMTSLMVITIDQAAPSIQFDDHIGFIEWSVSVRCNSQTIKCD